MNRKRTVLRIRIARTNADIRRCFPVMSQLRPKLTEMEFVRRVRCQMRHGHYALACLWSNRKPRGLAGFRISESLCDGRSMCVDDFVTDETQRSKGYGSRLSDWLVARGKKEGCTILQLDSGIVRFDAHRFYLRKRMRISSHHFSLPLSD